MPPSKLQPHVRAAQHDVRRFASDLAPKTTKSPLWCGGDRCTCSYAHQRGLEEGA